MSIYSQFIKYPTGKIAKGAWCSVCKTYNTRKITVTVLGVRNKRILMILRARDPEKGKWALPGGYLDWDETVEQAGRREFAEETGYRAENLRLLGIYSDPSRDADGRQNVDISPLARLLSCPMARTCMIRSHTNRLPWVLAQNCISDF